MSIVLQSDGNNTTLLKLITLNFLFHGLISGNIFVAISDDLPRDFHGIPITERCNICFKDSSKFDQRNSFCDYFAVGCKWKY